MQEGNAQVVASLARQLRDVELAQDCTQDAWLKAFETWPRQGIPDNPLAWILRVAHRSARDALRHRQVVLAAQPRLQPQTQPQSAPAFAEDDQLALLFACCHPSLNPVAQVGMALRSLCGLSTDEIARAFVEAPTATKRRLSRASAKIRDCGIPIAVPGPDKFNQRLDAVLASIYLTFNEGYVATESKTYMRPRLCQRAIELAQRLWGLLPAEPEVGGLLALMTLHHARRDGRIDAQGEPVALEDQDRSLWHRQEIEVGQTLLAQALGQGQPGAYQVQAAIAALHAQAPDAEHTDWPQIAALYGVLLRHIHTPVVELNAAVALGMSAGPQVGLEWLARLKRQGDAVPYLVDAARADLLRRAGQLPQAQAATLEALRTADNPFTRHFLHKKLSELVLPGERRRRKRLPELEQVDILGTGAWEPIDALFPRPKGRGRPPRPARELLQGIAWVLLNGAPWRAFPRALGPWRTAYHRYRVWERDGRLLRAFEILAPHSTHAATTLALLRGLQADSFREPLGR